MANQYGGKPANQPRNGFPSLNSDSPIIGEGDSVSRLVGSSDITIDELIQMHLVDCTQCRDAILHDRPRAIGQRSGHCNTYWELQLMRAKDEGQRNNIVAYTEYGDEAQKGRPLE